jgi:hypothetical protein
MITVSVTSCNQAVGSAVRGLSPMIEPGEN